VKIGRPTSTNALNPTEDNSRNARSGAAILVQRGCAMNLIWLPQQPKCLFGLVASRQSSDFIIPVSPLSSRCVGLLLETLVLCFWLHLPCQVFRCLVYLLSRHASCVSRRRSIFYLCFLSLAICGIFLVVGHTLTP